MENYCKWELDQTLVKEVRGWLAEGNGKGFDHFKSRLKFGTAGLRARMGPGLDQMNTVTVMQATQGVLRHIEGKLGPENGASRGIGIAFDSRHNSEVFAAVTATICLRRGFKVLFHDTPVPTPILAYTAKLRSTAAAIMITASHNPKEDNGYKLYGEDACQIIPPDDVAIQKLIEENCEPWSDYSDASVDSVTSHRLCSVVTNNVVREYLAEVTKKLHRVAPEINSASPRIVYSAFHGVGAKYVKLVFANFGLPDYIPVEEQLLPDPDFPTLRFPNPEEGKGAMELSISTAEAYGSTVILANDPDADRLAIAEKQENGQWRLFTGNEIGSLLGYHLWEVEGQNAPEGQKFCMVSSAVSSKALGAMAAREGFVFLEALTGFKWLSHVALQARSDGIKPLVTFEEAIGFMLADVVYDKDGISAAAVAAEMVAKCYQSGMTLGQRLSQFYDTYGYFIGYNGYRVCRDPSTMRMIFSRLREYRAGGDIDGVKIYSTRDVGAGTDTAAADGKSDLPTVGGTDFFTLRLSVDLLGTGEPREAPNLILCYRASGTEPKFKFYSELCCSRAEVERGAHEKLRAIVNSTTGHAVNFTTN